MKTEDLFIVGPDWPEVISKARRDLVAV